MEFLQRLRQQLQQIWQGMSAPRRVLFVALTLVCGAIIAGVGYWAAQPDLRVLFSGLAPEDAAAVSAKLQSQGISYRLGANGTTVLVPADQVAQARVDLAAEGLPSK